jgi:hypothetical protein
MIDFNAGFQTCVWCLVAWLHVIEEEGETVVSGLMGVHYQSVWAKPISEQSSVGFFVHS